MEDTTHTREELAARLAATTSEIDDVTREIDDVERQIEALSRRRDTLTLRRVELTSEQKNAREELDLYYDASTRDGPPGTDADWAVPHSPSMNIDAIDDADLDAAIEAVANDAANDDGSRLTDADREYLRYPHKQHVDPETEEQVFNKVPEETWRRMSTQDKFEYFGLPRDLRHDEDDVGGDQSDFEDRVNEHFKNVEKLQGRADYDPTYFMARPIDARKRGRATTAPARAPRAPKAPRTSKEPAATPAASKKLIGDKRVRLVSQEDIDRMPWTVHYRATPAQDRMTAMDVLCLRMTDLPGELFYSSKEDMGEAAAHFNTWLESLRDPQSTQYGVLSQPRYFGVAQEKAKDGTVKSLQVQYQLKRADAVQVEGREEGRRTFRIAKVSDSVVGGVFMAAAMVDERLRDLESTLYWMHWIRSDRAHLKEWFDDMLPVLKTKPVKRVFGTGRREKLGVGNVQEAIHVAGCAARAPPSGASDAPVDTPVDAPVPMPDGLVDPDAMLADLPSDVFSLAFHGDDNVSDTQVAELLGRSDFAALHELGVSPSRLMRMNASFADMMDGGYPLRDVIRAGATLEGLRNEGITPALQSVAVLHKEGLVTTDDMAKVYPLQSFQSIGLTL